jgi:type IV pilus assembly protein PilM
VEGFKCPVPRTDALVSKRDAMERGVVAMGRGTSVGLDIGSSCVRAAEVGSYRGEPTLVRFGQVALPRGAVAEGEIHDRAAVVAAIKELWQASRFAERRVVVGFANPRLAIRPVEVPFYRSVAELRQALPYIVADQVPMDAAEAVLDFAALEEIRNSDGSRQLAGLLVAGVEATVSTYVECAQAAGLKPTCVDLSPFAALRACVPTQSLGLTTHPEAVIEIGADLTHIVIHENGMPRFVRILPLGGATITFGLVDELGLDLAQAEAVKREVDLAGGGPDDRQSRVVGRIATHLAEEIRGTLDYFAATSARGPVGRVLLSGGGSRLQGFAVVLGERLHVPVVTASPLSEVRRDRTGLSEAQLRYIDPLASVALGLAMGVAA